MNLINNLGKVSILTEAQDDNIFDIDKEVDAQINRVKKRLERKQAKEQEQQNQEQQEEENNTNDNQSEEPENTDVDEQNDDNVEDQNAQQDQNNDSDNNSDGSDGQSDEYDYMENNNDIPDNYEPKQTIPELKILSTLSDKEYKLCNINILKDFQDLKNNVASVIKNLIPSVTTKNVRQRQAIDIVRRNLYDMLDDIDNYIIYRNNNIYEENVRAYLTYLKRYQIATNIVRLIVEENLKYDKEKNI